MKQCLNPQPDARHHVAVMTRGLKSLQSTHTSHHYFIRVARPYSFHFPHYLPRYNGYNMMAGKICCFDLQIFKPGIRFEIINRQFLFYFFFLIIIIFGNLINYRYRLAISFDV